MSAFSIDAKVVAVRAGLGAFGVVRAVVKEVSGHAAETETCGSQTGVTWYLTRGALTIVGIIPVGTGGQTRPIVQVLGRHT